MRRRRVPFVPQMEDAECGAACLAMILGHWGHHASLQGIREACQVSRDGARAAAILAAAHRHGLEADAVKVDLQDLDALPLPAILHWHFDHFVVLEELGGAGAVLIDPSSGRSLVSRDELSRSFTGVAMIFAPSRDFLTRPQPALGIGRYLEAIRGLRPALGMVLGATFMLQVVGLFPPAINQLLVDRVLMPGQGSWLWGLALCLGVVALARMALLLVRSYLLQGLQNLMDRRLSEGFIRHLLTLPISFFLVRQPGDLLQRTESLAQIREILSTRTVSAFLDASLLLGYTVMMTLYHPGLGSLVALLGGVQGAAILVVRHRSQQLAGTELTLQGQETNALVEALDGIETIKASGGQNRALARWWPCLVRRMNVNAARRRLALRLEGGRTAVHGLCLAAMFLVGGGAVLREEISLGVFVAFLTIHSLFLGPLHSLLEACSDLQLLRSHFLRLDDVLDALPEPTGNLSPGRLNGHIRLQAVTFQYSAGSPLILRELDLTIGAGEKVALVGRSGAGKSTLARLLLGMHPPTGGRILFDGQDLALLDLTALRAQVGVVLQEPFLFDATVSANLSLKEPELPLEHLRWATEQAQVRQVIEQLPEGFNTRIGPNGSLLSGGERQRLCLARAIARRPAILLLDEATSALDLETERQVHGRLAALGCTRIVIAHRLETVKDADRILVLEQGGIIAQGTYEDLAGRPGLFQEMVLAMAGHHG